MSFVQVRLDRQTCTKITCFKLLSACLYRPQLQPERCLRRFWTLCTHAHAHTRTRTRTHTHTHTHTRSSPIPVCTLTHPRPQFSSVPCMNIEDCVILPSNGPFYTCLHYKLQVSTWNIHSLVCRWIVPPNIHWSIQVWSFYLQLQQACMSLLIWTPDIIRSWSSTGR